MDTHTPGAFKFRVWDRERREMRQGPNFLIDSAGSLYWQFGFDEAKCLSRQDYDVVFSTGLTDKNGKEIYAGDVLRVPGWKKSNSVAVVEYLEVDGSDDMGTNMIGFPRYDDYGEPEVIGNIYADPELMKEPK